MQSLFRQALTMLGTVPSIVTLAASTNSPKALPKGAPCNQLETSQYLLRARVAIFKNSVRFEIRVSKK